MWKWVFVLGFGLAGSSVADPVDNVMVAAHNAFDKMPRLQRVETLSGSCGADSAVNRNVAYCTTQNTIYLNDAASGSPPAPYLVAHVLGHAAQVQHGIADIALREIRSRRSEEQLLRSYVAAQVDCIAGFLYARAGLPPASLADWFVQEPFTGTHWGRDPLRVGPRVSIGIAQRDQWFVWGQSADDLSNCAAGEFGAEQLLGAFKGGK